MIGQLYYNPDIVQQFITVQMKWDGDDAQGVMHLPETVIETLKATDFYQLEVGLTLMFPMALGLAVTLATLTFTPLCLSGDKSVWSEKWGRLVALENREELFH